MSKRYLSADELLMSSYSLAAKVLNDGFLPDFIVAVWRGGTPIGIAVQEFMEYCGVKTDHIAIRTTSYHGVEARNKEVSVVNMGYLLEHIEAHHKLLIVDDVFDSGNTIVAILNELRNKAKRNAPEQIRVATPFFKPTKNQTDIVPDYFIEELDSWIVFPHSLVGLSPADIAAKDKNITELLNQTQQIVKQKED